jgi:hypothetical protein
MFQKFKWIETFDLSARGPGRLGSIPFALAGPRLTAAVAAHNVDGLNPAAFGAECYEAAVR